MDLSRAPLSFGPSRFLPRVVFPVGPHSLFSFPGEDCVSQVSGKDSRKRLKGSIKAGFLFSMLCVMVEAIGMRNNLQFHTNSIPLRSGEKLVLVFWKLDQESTFCMPMADSY